MSTSTAIVPRLKVKYNEEIRDNLKTTLELSNVPLLAIVTAHLVKDLDEDGE